jgi:hypothetical protein
MRKSLVFAMLVGALVMATAPTAMAAQVTPTLLAGNPSCEGGVKIEPVADGVFAVPGGTITIDVTNGSFNFTASAGVTVFQVIVKGGPNANLYDYAPLGGVTSDTGLTSPLNPNTGRPFGLSHLCFFTDEKKPPPPPK